MDPLLVVLLAVVVAAVGWVVVRRRRPAPVEDEWVLPPEGDGPSILARRSTEAPGAASGPGASAMGGAVLDRDVLLNRDRTFDPSRWDDTPDAVSDDRGIVGSAEPDGAPGDDGDLPRFFDRDYLERLREQRDEGGRDADEG